MFCSNCGSQVGDNEKFCKVCGTAVIVQAAPAVYQQPVQAAPQAVPAVTNIKAGPRRTCFVIGLITNILLIIEIFPVFVIGGMMFFVGPFAMMLGASNYEDLFVYGILICLAAVILIALAVVSIVFNGISTKITAKRPASKCKSFRIAAAVMTLIDAVIVIAPVIGVNIMMSDAQFFYVLFGISFVMSIVFMILAVITNSKEKQVSAS